MNRAVKTFAFSALLLLAQMSLAFGGHATAHAQTARPGRRATATSPARKAPAQEATAQTATRYACPMHPSVKSSSRRSKCPKCGMALRAVEAEANPSTADSTASSASAMPVEGATGALEKPLRVPDTAVYDQNGRRLNFYTDLVKGKTVAINFIFTTCTTICPPLAATFRKVQKELGPKMGREVEMISISVDPTTDTPERLKSFSAKFGAGPGWTFVTGSKTDIDQLLRALGASTADKMAHTPMVLVGNDDAGYWTRTYGLSPASSIVKLMTEASSKPALNLSARNGGPAAAPGDATSAAQTEQAAGQMRPLAEISKSYFPNNVLLTQDGQPVRFYDDVLKGKIVLINFMFATCKGVCSPMTANLVKVQKYLGEHVGREVAMISISVDPEVDTPPALKKYVDGFKVQPGWYFLTGKRENVDVVLRKLGGYAADPSQHSAVLIIGDEATGEWMKMHAMGKPTDIAASVKQLIEARGKTQANTTTQPGR